MAFWRLNLLCSGARENTRKNSKVQNCQVLRPYNSYPPAPKLTYNTSLESPNIFLYEKFKKVDLKAFLSSFMNTQSNLVSYHKTTIVPVSLRLAVYHVRKSLLHYQAFTFKWVKMFLKMLEYEVCISLNAF